MELKNKKILIVCTTDNMFWQFLMPHIQQMKNMGATVEGVCAKTGFWFDELKNEYNLTLHEIDIKRSPFKLKNILSYSRLIKLQKQNKYDLIYCHQAVSGAMARFLGKKFKVPVIYVAHGFFFYKNCKLKNKLLYKTAESFMSKYTTALITINNEDYEASLKMKAKYNFITNGIGFNPNHTVTSSDFDGELLKRQLGIQPDEKVIITISELIPRKNYKIALQAISLIAKQEKFKYLIVGCGRQDKELKKYTKKLNIQDKVLFLGYRKDIGNLLAISDIMLHTSIHEGLTISILESMNAKVPVITSNARGNVDLIDHEKGGFVCDTFDVQSYKKYLQKLLNDEQLCKKFAEYNKQKCQKYTVDNVLKEYEEIYEKI